MLTTLTMIPLFAIAVTTIATGAAYLRIRVGRA